MSASNLDILVKSCLFESCQHFSIVASHRRDRSSANAHLLGRVVVVANHVGRALEVARHTVLGASRLEVVGDAGHATRPVHGDGVEGKADGVGSSHGGTGNGVGVGVAAVPGREDADAGAEDVESGAVVGEVGNGPVRVDGTDRDGAGSRGGGHISGVLALVTGGDNGQDTLGRGRVDGIVEGGGLGTTQGHVDGCGLGAPLAHDVVDGPVEALEDDGSRRRRALEDLDGKEVSLLGDTVRLATNGAGDVGAVAKGIGGIPGESSKGLRGTALELRVRGADASVDDVGVRVQAGVGVVDVVGGARLAVGDCAQAPRGAVLSGQCLLLQSNRLILDKGKIPDLVRFNLSDLS